MYQYLRKMMDLAEEFGRVQDVYMGENYANVELLQMDGTKVTITARSEEKKDD